MYLLRAGLEGVERKGAAFRNITTRRGLRISAQNTTHVVPAFEWLHVHGAGHPYPPPTGI